VTAEIDGIAAKVYVCQTIPGIHETDRWASGGQSVRFVGVHVFLGQTLRPAVIATAAAFAALALVGCGVSRDEQAAAPEPEAVRAGLQRATAGRIKVALVPPTGGSPEYNALAIKGLQDAVVKLRVKGTVVEPRSASEYVGTLSDLARRGYDFVISVGGGMATATRLAAQRFPNTMFAIVDHAYSPGRTLPNVEGLTFDEAQAGYLVGYLSGMMSRTRVMSAMAGDGAAAQRFVRGFRAGAKATKRGLRILVVPVPVGAAQDACRRIALGQIERGADVVFPVAGTCSLGALEAAGGRGVWGVGVDTDQSYLGPHILASAVKNVDVAVFDAIQGVANGAVEDSVGTMAPYGFHGGGVTVYGAQYRAIGLGRVSPTVSPRLLARIDAIKRLMTGGAIVIGDGP